MDGGRSLKKCYDCGEHKEYSNFYKNRAKKDGHSDECKSCGRVRNRKHYVNNKEKWHASTERSRRRRLYGMEEGDYEKLLEKQKGRCAICGTDTPTGRGKFHIDHCHSSGVVRGLLCSRCNQAIGLLQEDEHILTRALEYVRLHNNAQSWEEAGH
jgi:hypothetical protein